MKSSYLGELKTYDSPETTMSMFFSYRDHKYKFVLSSNLQTWSSEVKNCITFTKIYLSLLKHEKALKQKYFFKTKTKVFYNHTTYSFGFDSTKMQIQFNSGLMWGDSTEWNDLMSCSGTMVKQLDDMIYRMKIGLPSGRVASLLEECKELATGVPVRSSF